MEVKHQTMTNKGNLIKRLEEINALIDDGCTTDTVIAEKYEVLQNFWEFGSSEYVGFDAKFQG